MADHNTQRSGRCPYCAADNYDLTKTEVRRPGQSLMCCAGCSKWSVRMRGAQYPLQAPIDKTSSPTTSGHE